MTNGNPSTPRMAFIIIVGTMALLATACGGGSGTSAGVASLEDVAGAESTDAGGAAEDESLSPDEAALAFSQCMRDEGLDFPDIGVNAEGVPDIGDAFQSSGVDRGSDEFRDAIQTCAENLEGIGFGGGGRGAFLDNPEIQDAFVEFSECIREQGFDVGDLQLGGGPGAGGPGAGGPPNAGEDGPQPGQGQRQGGFGDRSGRIASALGLDPDDPDVVAAVDECNPILETALGGFAQGAGRGPGAGN
jgi:hypothetical protein